MTIVLPDPATVVPKIGNLVVAHDGKVATVDRYAVGPSDTICVVIVRRTLTGYVEETAPTDRFALCTCEKPGSHASHSVGSPN